MAFHYVEADTVIHRLDPRTKLVYFFAVTGIGTSFFDPVILSIILLSMWIPILVGRLQFVTLRLYRVMSFVYVSYGVYYAVIYVLLPLSHGVISTEGICWSLSAPFRIVILFTGLAVLLCTTRIVDLVVAFTKSKIPTKMALATGISFGMVPVFEQEINDVRDAYESRGYKTRYRNIVRRVVSMFPMLGPVLFLSIRRSQMIAVALESKGFGSDPKKRTYRREVQFRRNDYIFLAVSIGILLMAIANRMMSTERFFITQPLLDSLFHISS